MSALGHKRTLDNVRAMSALPPKADVGTGTRITLDAATPAVGDIRRDPPRLIAPVVCGLESD
jgi:hypothetical protein